MRSTCRQAPSSSNDACRAPFHAARPGGIAPGSVGPARPCSAQLIAGSCAGVRAARRVGSGPRTPPPSRRTPAAFLRIAARRRRSRKRPCRPARRAPAAAPPGTPRHCPAPRAPAARPGSASRNLRSGSRGAFVERQLLVAGADPEQRALAQRILPDAVLISASQCLDRLPDQVRVLETLPGVPRPFGMFAVSGSASAAGAGSDRPHSRVRRFFHVLIAFLVVAVAEQRESSDANPRRAAAPGSVDELARPRDSTSCVLPLHVRRVENSSRRTPRLVFRCLSERPREQTARRAPSGGCVRGRCAPHGNHHRQLARPAPASRRCGTSRSCSRCAVRDRLRCDLPHASPRSDVRARDPAPARRVSSSTMFAFFQASPPRTRPRACIFRPAADSSGLGVFLGACLPPAPRHPAAHRVEAHLVGLLIVTENERGTGRRARSATGRSPGPASSAPPACQTSASSSRDVVEGVRHSSRPVLLDGVWALAS